MAGSIFWGSDRCFRGFRRVAMARLDQGGFLMPYVIKKGHRYVAQMGSDKSYTPYLQNARKFPTREQAEIEKCGDESVVDALNEIGGGMS
jgi:hypothetical protein